ncbi:MAG TPA: hypothetical protein VLC09_20325 [Polyangiaceae bacterium]|nr:hypothetical protein [Polyangiaceae bacterium]
MPRRWIWLGLLLTSLSLGTGCAHPAERALAGRWHGESVENFTLDEMAAATAWARGTSFEFDGPNLTVEVPAEEPRRGTYRLAAIEDRTVKLTVLDSAGEQSELELVVDDKTSLRWMLGDGRALVLKRAQ